MAPGQAGTERDVLTETTIAISGARGFIGSHLVHLLARRQEIRLRELGRDDFADRQRLADRLAGCDAVAHLAGFNRGDDDEVYDGNVRLADSLCEALSTAGGRPHVVFSSSTQIDADNPYARSKIVAAERLADWARASNAPLSVMVIPNVFGDGGRPFYNSVVATFCHQVAHGETPVLTGDRELGLISVNELAVVIATQLANPPAGVAEIRVPPVHHVTVSEILERVRHFDAMFRARTVPALDGTFDLSLYCAYLTYLPKDDLAVPLTRNTDKRGTLVEMVRQEGGGQAFFSTTKPGVIRGNHYHTRKMEKFIVVAGQARIRMRRIGTDEVVEFDVNGEKPCAVEMPIYHTHHIENTGDTDLITLFWTNELYDPDDPDTFFEEVLK